MRQHVQHLILAMAALLATTDLRGGQSASIEGYIKDDKGRALKAFDIWVASGCETTVYFGLKNSAPTGQKHTRTDKDGYYRLSVKPDQAYYLTAGRGNAYALVHVHGAEAVRYDPKLGQNFNFIWCISTPPAWLVTVVDGNSRTPLAPSPLEAPPGRRQVSRPPQDQDPNSPWWRDDSGLLWAKESNSSDTNWSEADSYCRSLTLGGTTGWRLPTMDELQALYDLHSSFGDEIRVSVFDFDHLASQWSSTKTNADGAWMMFLAGTRIPARLDVRQGVRALCVRSDKR
jgi:hypothetical protein